MAALLRVSGDDCGECGEAFLLDQLDLAVRLLAETLVVLA